MATQSITTALPAQHSRGWFKRNWKWFVPALILGPLLIGAAGIGGFVLLRANGYKSSEPYQMALSEVRQSTEVADRLGAPVADGWNPSGNLPTDSKTGMARFNFSIYGPTGKADVSTAARLVEGEWGVTQLEVTFADGTRQSLMEGIRKKQAGDMPRFDPNAKPPATGDAILPPPPTDIDIPDIGLGIPDLPPGVK